MTRHIVSFVMVTAWAILVLVCVAAIAIGDAFDETDAPADVVRLPPGGRAWQPLHRPDDRQWNIRLIELADGRVAFTGMVEMHPEAPTETSCDLWDPKTGAWSQQSAVIPDRFSHRRAISVPTHATSRSAMVTRSSSPPSPKRARWSRSPTIDRSRRSLRATKSSPPHA